MMFPTQFRHIKIRDITVRAHLLDIDRVDYSILDREDPTPLLDAYRINPRFHENGKGLAHGDLNGDGYANIEDFINDLDPSAPKRKWPTPRTYQDLWNSDPDLRASLKRQ